MRYFRIYITLLSICIMAGCGYKDCTKWYSGLKFHAATSRAGAGDRWFSYRETDFLVNELNFLFIPHYSQDGYEECATVTMKHTLLAENISITSEQPLFITDTIPSGTNILAFFKKKESYGNYLFEYDTSRFDFPKFQSQYNKFYFEAPLSDTTFLRDTVVVKIQG